MKYIIDIIKKFLVKCNIIKNDFYSQGFIYIKNGKPCKYPTDKIKWLEEINIHCYYKDLDDVAFEAFSNMYPQYKGFIYLY